MKRGDSKKANTKKGDEIEVPEILPPTDDAVFKTLMTHPDTRDCLKDMIICYTGVRVQRVDLLNNELPVSNIMEKMERLDVNCITDSRQQVNVEMQASRLKGDNALNDHVGVKGRFVFNLCDLHSSQSGHGIIYSDFIRSYQITFLGYGIFSGRSNPFNWFTLRNEEGDVLIDSINIGFIELTKLGDILKKPVSAMTGADSWAVFIKYADNPRYKGVIEELVKARKEIAMANEVLTHISKDDHERAKFRSRQKFIADMEHNLLVSRDEGIAIGKTEGIAIGKTEGKTEGIALGRLEAARAMLKKGYSIQDIIDITQLSFEEINNLRNFK